eukprot:11110472-Ditylum_brightwellii.AAC.1
MQADGTPLHVPHNMYVDDNLIAEIPSRIRKTMATSIEAHFILMGFPEPHRRRNAACVEKFLASMCSYEKQQLGKRLNTRTVTAGMVLVKLAEITAELQPQHKKRKSFNIRQLATLTVSLKFVSSRYKNHEQYIKSKKISSDDELKAHFAQHHAAKMTWSYSKSYFINTAFRENLNILLKLLKSDYKWETPIAFLIPRDPDFTLDGESSIIAAGGNSLQLKFWWHLE